MATFKLHRFQVTENYCFHTFHPLVISFYKLVTALRLGENATKSEVFSYYEGCMICGERKYLIAIIAVKSAI